MEQHEHTADDKARTAQKLLNAVQGGRGVQLSPVEAERVMFIIAEAQNFGVGMSNKLDQTQGLLGGILHHLFMTAGAEALSFPDEMMDNDVVSFSVRWDELEHEITFELEYPNEEVVEGEVVSDEDSDSDEGEEE